MAPGGREEVRRAAGPLGWDERDTDALLRVMRDEATELVRPEGLDDPRRWWVVGGVPWDWTPWRTGDGTHALEVVSAGWSVTCRTEVLAAEQVQAWHAEGAPFLDHVVRRLRDA